MADLNVFRFEVTVTAETVEQARQVMSERIDYDEEYGFEYRVNWTVDDETVAVTGEPTMPDGWVRA